MSARDARCPLCRELRPLAAERAIADAMSACGLRLRCTGCGASTAVDDVEAHRAWCSAHRFVCPHTQCTRCVPAAGMSSHVALHEDVPRLLVGADGARHVVFALALHSLSDALVLEVGGVVVVVDTTHRRLPMGLAETTPPVVQLMARAYYPTPAARALRLAVRLLRVAGCDTGHTFCEEHHLGVVPPMLASRETIVLTNVAATLLPRTVIAEDADPRPENPFFLELGRPAAGLAERARRAGLRDLPHVQAPLAIHQGTPAAFVHLCFREDARLAVSEVYRE